MKLNFLQKKILKRDNFYIYFATLSLFHQSKRKKGQVTLFMFNF